MKAPTSLPADNRSLLLLLVGAIGVLYAVAVVGILVLN